MKRRPAAFLWVSALAGACIGITWPGPWWIGVIASCIMIMLAMRISWLCIINVLLFTLLLTAWAASHMVISHEQVIKALPHGTAIFFGVVHDVRTAESGSVVLFARIKPVDDHDRSPIKVKIKLEEGLAATPVVPGQAIRFRGEIKPFYPALSPVHFDGERYALVSGFHGRITLTDMTSFWAGKQLDAPYFATLRMKLRHQILQVVTPHEASLLLALMIGDTDLMSSRQDELYQRIGAQHLLAVSGLQVTLLSFLCFFMLTPIFVMVLGKYFYRAQALSAFFTLLLTGWFIGLADFSSSSVRAFLMTGFLLLPTIWARRIDRFDALYASGLVVVLVMPLVVLDAGFWLSYAAVFGLLLANHYSVKHHAVLRERSVLLPWIFAAFIASLAAFLATLPLLVVLFGSFAPYSILSNFFLVPFSSLVQIPAIIFGLMGCLLNWPIMISIAAFCSNLIEIMAEVLANYFASIAYAPALWPLWMLALLIVMACAFYKKAWSTSMVTAVLLLISVVPFFAHKDLVVSVLAVGQGDATLFSTPQGKHILLDAGGSAYGSFDPGARIVVPTLKRKGVRELEVLIISHPDPDHILGAFAVLDEFKVNQIWHSGFKEGHPQTKRLISEATRKGIVIKSMPALLGRHVIDGVAFTVMAPNTMSKEPYFQTLSANNNSLVLGISYGKHSLLWPGDLEAVGERMLLASGISLRADVVKAPHHGSKTSSTIEFVEAIRPAHVIYSTGRDNRFKFPHHEVFTRYQSIGAQAWNTALDGEITINVGEKELSIKGFLRE